MLVVAALRAHIWQVGTPLLWLTVTVAVSAARGVCVCIAARYTVRQFSIRRNEAIAVHVTVRGPKALDLLERGLRVKEFELDRANFSATGTAQWVFRALQQWGAVACACRRAWLPASSGDGQRL